LKFRTKLVLSGKSAAGVQVPAEIMQKLGSSKRPAVLVAIKGQNTQNAGTTPREIDHDVARRLNTPDVLFENHKFRLIEEINHENVM
jgi:hypothetical protein